MYLIIGESGLDLDIVRKYLEISATPDSSMIISLDALQYSYTYDLVAFFLSHIAYKSTGH